MQYLQQHNKIISNIRHVYTCTFIVAQLIASLPFFYSTTWFFQRILLVIGAIFIVYYTIMFFLRRNDIEKNNTPYALIMFVLWYAFVIVAKRDLLFSENLKIYGYMLIQSIIVFGNEFSEQDSRNRHFNEVTQKIILLLLTIVSLASLSTFFIYKTGYSYIKYNTLYSIGWYEGRLSGIVGNPNVLAMYAASAIFLALSVHMKPQMSIMVFGINFIVLLMTKSRGTIAMFFLAVSLFALFRYRFNKKVKTLPLHKRQQPLFFHYFLRTIIALAIIALFYYLIQNGADLIKLLFNRGVSDSRRYELLQYGLRAFKHSPITGSTSKGVGVIASGLLTEGSAFTIDDPILANPHNTYVQILASSGIVGLLLFLWHVFGMMLRPFRKHDNQLHDRFASGSFASVVFFLLISFFECYIVFNASFLAFLFWYLSGRLWYSCKRKGGNAF